MKYMIYTDVSTDVDTTAVNLESVRFVSMEYSIGGTMRKCTGPESRALLKVFYDGQRGGDLTQTSQISPYLYEEAFRPAFEEGYSVLYLCLSSGLSSTYQSSLMAKQSLEEEFPGQLLISVDTLSATAGMGLLLERALRNQQAGMDIEANAASLRDAVTKLRHWFLVPDLMYLKRGGRISAATAVLGTALNITPILRIDEAGKLENFAKKRGQKMAAKQIVSQFKESYDMDNTEDPIYILDADNQEIAAYLEEEVRSFAPKAIIHRCELGPIIGAHTGPSLAAIVHMAK